MAPTRGRGAGHFASAFSSGSGSGSASGEDSPVPSSSNHTPTDSYASSSASSSSSSGSGSPRSSSGGSSSLPPATIIDIFGHPLPDDDALARLPDTFSPPCGPADDDTDEGAGSVSPDRRSSQAGSSSRLAVPRTSVVVEDYGDGGFSTEDEEAGETSRMLSSARRNASFATDDSLASRVSSRAPSPGPGSPAGGAFWGQAMSRKPSRTNLPTEAEVKEKDFAKESSEYFDSCAALYVLFFYANAHRNI